MTTIEEQLKKGKQLTLSSAERAFMRQEITTVVSRSTKRSPIRSPYMHQFSWTLFTKATAFVLIALLVGGGSLTYASERALPGDLLYPVKIHVKEELEVSLATTPIQKAIVQKKRIETRISEVKTLKAEGTLTAEKTETVKEAFIDHAKELNQNIDELQKEGDKQAVLSVTSDLIPTLKEFQKDTAVVKAPESTTPPAITPETTTLPAPATTTPENTSGVTLGAPALDVAPTTDTTTTSALSIDSNITLDATTTDTGLVSTDSTSTLPTAKEVTTSDANNDLNFIIGIEVAKIQEQQTETLTAPDTTPTTNTKGSTATQATNTSLEDQNTPSLEVDTPKMGTTLPEQSVTIGGTTIESVPLPQTGTLTGTVHLSAQCKTTFLNTCSFLENYAELNVFVYDATGKTLIVSLPVTAQGNFKIALTPGVYTINMQHVGTASSTALPTQITVKALATTTVTIRDTSVLVSDPKAN